MKYDRIYLLFIGVAVFSHLIASGLTYYALESHQAKECNPLMASQFPVIGHFIPAILTTLMLTGILFIVPYLYGQSKKIGLKSAVTMGVAAFLMSLDALHDIFVITDNPLGEITWPIMKTLLSVIHLITGTSPVC